MSSMKAEYLREVEHQIALAQRYGEGYAEGARDGYERAMQDIEKLKKLAAHEMLKGLGK